MILPVYGASPIPDLEDIGIPITSPIKDANDELIPGFLPLHGQVVISGETNVGKSLMALEIVSSCISGEPLWGQLQPQRKLERVLYILGEHYSEVIQRLALHTGLPFTEKVIILSPEELAWDKWLVTGGKVNLQSVHKLEKWLEGIDLVVWDPLAAFITGQEAENDNIQMRLVLQTMNDLTHAAGASGIVLAHQGKPMMDSNGKEQTRKTYAIRGASAIEDAATNIFYLGRARGESGAAEQIAEGELYSLACRKYKGLAPPEYRLLRNPHNLTHRLLGNRPFVEVRRLAMEGDVSRMMFKLNVGQAEAIRIVAAWRGMDEKSVKRALGMAF